MAKIRIVKPNNRQPNRQQFERAQLPEGVEYALFIVATAPDGFPVGQWLCLCLPSMDILSLPAAGFQPVWRLVSLIPNGLKASMDDLKLLLKSDHKIMSADRKSRS